MEVGNIVFSHVVQKGYVKADGQELYREDYPALYQFALENELLLREEEWGNNRQGMYSVGDGHMSFRVPDFRGQFLRVLDDGVGEDVGRLIGSKQGDAIRNITGKTEGNAHFGTCGGSGAMNSVRANVADTNMKKISAGSWVMDHYLDVSRVVPTADENRPKNIALIAQIKY